jgi:hypothetical protein
LSLRRRRCRNAEDKHDCQRDNQVWFVVLHD